MQSDHKQGASARTQQVKRDQGGEPPPRKKKSSMRGNRNQPIVSCLECRRMKWKCDREFPCANCRKRGLDTICPGGRLNGAKGDRELVLSLQDRVRQLEEALAETHKQFSPLSSHPLLAAHTSSFEQASSSQPTFLTHANVDPASPSSRRSSVEAAMEEENLDEDHGQLTLGDEPGSSGWFGNAGATYLSQRLEGDRKPEPARAWRFGFQGTPSGLTDSFPFPPSPFASREVTLEELHGYLPERQVAEHFTNIYFNHASFLNSMVDRNTFTSEFVDPLYGQNDPYGRINNHRLALAFLVFAIGAQMDLSLPPCNQIGEDFYQLARACLAYDPSGSVVFVQAIHIMGRYLANASKGPRSSQNFWTILGLGVRTAQQTGLHRDGLKWGLEKDEVEVRRKIFWEIYAEDAFQSVTQGRPRVIATSTIDAQFPSLPANPTAFDLYHHHKYRLAKILALVNDHQTRAATVPYAETMEVDKALRKLQSEIPPILTQMYGDEQHVYRNLSLRLYITEGFMFLHRMRFTRALRDHPREPLESPFRYSYVSQLESSRVMTEILQEALKLNEPLTTRFWIFFFHAFTSTVNFCATVIRSPTSSLAQAIFGQANDGIKLFENVGIEHRARDDTTTLHRLYERAQLAISSATSSRDQESANLIGLGTTLHRVQPKSSSPSASASVPTSFNRNMENSERIMLPTTLADAVAVQDDLLNLPFDFTGGLPDFTSDQMNMVPQPMQIPMEINNDAHQLDFNWSTTSMNESLNTNRDYGVTMQSNENHELDNMGIHPGFNLELDFDAFLAELGMSPQRF